MSTLQNTAAACLEADSASKLLLIIAKDVVGTSIAITVVLSMCSGYNLIRAFGLTKVSGTAWSSVSIRIYIYIHIHTYIHTYIHTNNAISVQDEEIPQESAHTVHLITSMFLLCGCC